MQLDSLSPRVAIKRDEMRLAKVDQSMALISDDAVQGGRECTTNAIAISGSVGSSGLGEDSHPTKKKFQDIGCIPKIACTLTNKERKVSLFGTCPIKRGLEANRRLRFV